MRVAVIGGGVIGITTAYYLAERGHDVTVLEREADLASVASRATGGHIAPGHSGAWASPRALRQLFRSLVRSDTSFRLRLGLDREFLGWTAAFMRNCTQERYWQNSSIKSRLILYSRLQLIELRESLDLQYDQAASGALFLFRSAGGMAAARERAAGWLPHGVELQVLTPDEIVRLDPRLAGPARVMAGGLYSALDEVGDTRLFTLALAERCRDLGVHIECGQDVRSIETSGGRVTGVVTADRTVGADAYVLANGAAASETMRGIGLRTPVYPLRGVTLTFPAVGDAIPTIGMVDEERLVAIARLGDRIRLGGVAVLGPRSQAPDPSIADYMVDAASELFPDGAAWDQPDVYVCGRPMTPDGPPILGPTPFPNLFMNVGHGHIGWTMATGAAAVVADLIDGREPAIRLDGMELARFDQRSVQRRAGQAAT